METHLIWFLDVKKRETNMRQFNQNGYNLHVHLKQSAWQKTDFPMYENNSWKKI